MNRTGRLTAILLLALWVFMISAPVVFGSPECTCPDCTGAFCAMKKHTSAQAAKVSCHENAQRRAVSFQKGACHHEVGPVAFSYNAILTDGNQAAPRPVQFGMAGVAPQLSGENEIPETPPPKRLSC